MFKNSLPEIQPEMNDSLEMRSYAEEKHHESQRKHFVMPLYINPAPTDTTRLLNFLDLFHRSRSRRLDHLIPDDCRLFCWKDCAIYGTNRVWVGDHLTLLDSVYREWFPHRAADKDVSDGSFFAKYMRFKQDTDVPLQDILRFHQVLCEKLCELEKRIPPTLPVNPCLAYPFRVQPKAAEYKLRETFLAVFIILDIGWQEHGVLLVFRSKDEISKYNCKADQELTRYNDGGDLGEACAFRCSLKRAMQLIVSTDPERVKQRAEYSEVIQEILGEVDDCD